MNYDPDEAPKKLHLGDCASFSGHTCDCVDAEGNYREAPSKYRSQIKEARPSERFRE